MTAKATNQDRNDYSNSGHPSLLRPPFIDITRLMQTPKDSAKVEKGTATQEPARVSDFQPRS